MVWCTIDQVVVLRVPNDPALDEWAPRHNQAGALASDIVEGVLGQRRPHAKALEAGIDRRMGKHDQ
jgi:hypothetical protein